MRYPVRKRTPLRIAAALAVLIIGISPVRAAQPPLSDDDLELEIIEGLDLEAIFRIPIVPVATVAGVPRPLLETPSAVTVLSREDIRRSGHRSLAEALRLVPGMYVGRSASHSWRVGARGFSGGLAPRNLVLIDGRAVYDPLHGGTFWEVQDIVFQDLDRIEVIRGPGATLWGANAMNGVINVITKSAHETQGLYISGGGGTYERAFTTVRYGDKIGEDTAFRVYGKYFNRDRFVSGTAPARDDWSMVHGGFRLDHNVDPDTTFTVISGGYSSLTMGEVVAAPPGPPQRRDQTLSGAHVLARIAHTAPDRTGWTLQTYYDRTNRQQAALDVFRDTVDLDFRHFFPWGEGHEFIWGLGYRFTTDRTHGSPTVFLDPRARSLNIFSGFVQNTFTLVLDRWFVMLGTKVEHNTFTGFEIQPGARMWWTPDENQTIWGAISRPVRMPSRIEQEGTLLTAAGPVLPGRNLNAEELLAYELGYRKQFTTELSADVTLFYHDYTRLISVPPPPFGLWNNDGRGESYGIELATDWHVADNWRLGGGYSFVRVKHRGPVFAFDEGGIPEHQAFIRSHLDITDNLFFDAVFYYYDNVPRPGVPRYGRLDVGLTWRPHNNLDVSIWGQNVTNRSTAEASIAREFPRGFYLMGTIRY